MTNQPASRFPQLSLAVFTINATWHISSFSPDAEKILGLTSSEVKNKSFQVLSQEYDRLADFFSKCSSIGQDSQVSSFNTVIELPDTGKYIDLLSTVISLPDNGGNFSGAVVSLQEASKSLLVNQLVLDSVADGVFIVDSHWKISSFNKVAESITGWKTKEVLGKSCSRIFHSNICGSACILAQSVKEKKRITDRPIFIKRKNGSTIPVNISAAPFFDHEGNIIGGIETFRDTTNIIRNDLIVNSVADGVFTVDRNWKITSFNRAAEKITGWPGEKAIGKSCSEIFKSSICGKNCAIAQCLYSGNPISSRSITIINASGEQIPISISAAPLTDPDGNIIGGVETFRDLSDITALRKTLSRSYSFESIISKSTAMQRIFKILPDIARSPSTALILGESGTGKELVARALYNAGNRSDKPFVIVNCGVLPETLLESELFGYKAGAFTDAKKDKQGRFAAAEKGTLFLDEIGDIPHSLQVKLLRVLQNKVYEPLGSNTPIEADVRIITATNRNLQELVRQGLFREDLFYRLNVVKINLPPLRERLEDIPLLTEHFIKQFSAQQGKDILGISSGALSLLMHYDYPGNIRELENVIEYAFILCEGGLIQPEHLPEPFYVGESFSAKVSVATGGSLTLEEIEKQAISLSLERNKWKRMATCRELSISKDTLRRKISRYGLENPLAEIIDD